MLPSDVTFIDVDFIEKFLLGIYFLWMELEKYYEKYYVHFFYENYVIRKNCSETLKLS